MHKAFLYPMRLLYPPRCVFCECILPLSVDYLLCDNCINDYPLIQEPVCRKCGKQVHIEDSLCTDCGITIHSYKKGIALYSYDGIVKEALYRFKYGGRRKYARLFAQIMFEQLKETYFLKELDLIVSVPISKERLAQRGYNQAEEVAKYVSRYSGIPYDKNILIRNRHTKPQSSFTPTQRRHNIKNAFACTYQLPPEHKVILIIDDIYTTGSTMNECAKALKGSGAQVVYSSTICIGH